MCVSFTRALTFQKARQSTFGGGIAVGTAFGSTPPKSAFGGASSAFGAGVKNPGAGVKNPGAGVKNPGAGVKNPGGDSASTRTEFSDRTWKKEGAGGGGDKKAIKRSAMGATHSQKSSMLLLEAKTPQTRFLLLPGFLLSTPRRNDT